jgi:hypothetical protein
MYNFLLLPYLNYIILNKNLNVSTLHFYTCSDIEAVSMVTEIIQLHFGQNIKVSGYIFVWHQINCKKLSFYCLLTWYLKSQNKVNKVYYAVNFTKMQKYKNKSFVEHNI